MIVKTLFLKDTETGKYYSGNYEWPWTRDISDAKEFENESYITSDIIREIENETSIFENIKSMEVVTILKIKK